VVRSTARIAVVAVVRDEKGGSKDAHVRGAGERSEAPPDHRRPIRWKWPSPAKVVIVPSRGDLADGVVPSVRDVEISRRVVSRTGRP